MRGACKVFLPATLKGAGEELDRRLIAAGLVLAVAAALLLAFVTVPLSPHSTSVGSSSATYSSTTTPTGSSTTSTTIQISSTADTLSSGSSSSTSSTGSSQSSTSAGASESRSTTSASTTTTIGRNRHREPRPQAARHLGVPIDADVRRGLVQPVRQISGRSAPRAPDHSCKRP